MQALPLPRKLNAAETFDSLVNWVHDEMVVKKQCPGLVVGVSGTDSILAFLVCYEAFKKAGHPERVAAIHYGEQADPADESLPDWQQPQSAGFSEASFHG